MVLGADSAVWDAGVLLQPLGTRCCPPVPLHWPKWCFSGAPDVRKLILLFTTFYKQMLLILPKAQSL